MNISPDTELDLIRQQLTTVLDFLSQAPEGSLAVATHGRKHYYYRRIRQHRLQHKLVYLNESQSNLIDQLATKKYYQKLLPALRNEEKALSSLLTSYDPQAKIDAYQNLNPLIAEHVRPLFTSASEEIAEAVRQWKNAPHSLYTAHAENLRYQTEQGEFVRSKSELIIANYLFRHRDRLLYRYEPTLLLPVSNYTAHPDFEILNCETGEVFYWEHNGGLGIPGYIEYFVQKMNAYSMEGPVFQSHLLMTYETGEASLNQTVMEHHLHVILHE